jgi:hypothetical protein
MVGTPGEQWGLALNDTPKLDARSSLHKVADSIEFQLAASNIWSYTFFVIQAG